MLREFSPNFFLALVRAFFRACWTLFVWVWVSSPVFSLDADPQHAFNSFFPSARTFQTTPTEGITLLSSSGTDAFLIDGESDEIVLSYVFMPPNGSTTDQYTIAFSCESSVGSVIPVDSSCSITNAVADILNSEVTALNSTVTCMATAIPGAATCGLTATPISVQRMAIDNSPRKEALAISPAVWTVRQDAAGVYSSETISINVYGVIIYRPDNEGELSDDSQIFSGAANGFEKASYDRTVQGVQELSIFAYVPGMGSVIGAIALSLFEQAEVTTEVGDYIFWFKTEQCSLTDASIENSAVALDSSGTCDIGIAAETDSTPKLGFQFRTFKSGNFTLRMIWNTFGTSQEVYEQSITFRITETAPPVITAIQKEAQYRSVPCDAEQLTMTAYNVRFADTRALVVQNSNGGTTTWSEVETGVVYDSSTDMSTVVFDSAGGEGTNVAFTLQVSYGETEITGVVLDTSLETTMSFSTPPVISSMSPVTTAVDGGEEIVLTGSFDGFGASDFIIVGGYTISGALVSVPNSTTLVFLSPALSSLGQPFAYDIAVGVCAETSNSFTLSYKVTPQLIITAVDSDTDDTDTYIIPSEGSASFLAEVSGNNGGIEYVWKLFTSNGEEIETGETKTNSQLISVSSSLLTSTTEVFNLSCTVQNSLQLTDSASVSVRLAEEGVEYLLVSVYPVQDISISVDAVTLVQSSVQYITDTSSVSTLQGSEVSLQWFFGDQEFVVDNSSADSQVTGPTQLGLEFNIARTDLRVGKTSLELIASLVDKPEITGRGIVDINVVASALRPEINNGVNGSLILTGTDLVLSGANSSDPDIISGDSSAGLTYMWFGCVKSLRSTFSTGVEDCSSLLPIDVTSAEITIPAASLSDARLDTQSDPDPTFLSFALRVSKGERSSEQYLYFELQTATVTGQVPELSSLRAVDVKGVPLQQFSVFSDIIIRPESEDNFASWSYDMALSGQKFLFSQGGVLKTGDGFITSRGVKSRDLLGFVAGSLQPSTEYVVSARVSTSNSSLEADYEISFRTDDAPSLTCVPPEVTTGTIFETRFVVGAQMSFETQNIEYCFYLVSNSRKRYRIGKGCSPVQFAEFSFPFEGVYSIECLAKTVSGAIVDNITVPSAITLATPTPSPGASADDILTTRLEDLNAEVSSCEALRDHSCVESLIAVATEITAEVETLLASDTSTEVVELFEACKDYIARLSTLSESLADRTVFRPNQIEDSLNQALYMSQVSSSFVDSEATLFGYMKSAENAVNSTTSETSDAIIGNEVVDTVSAIANLTLATSYSLSQGGSSRTRLRQQAGATRSAYGAVLNTATRFIVQMRSQQETCGFVGSESTMYPDTLEGSGRSTSSEVDIPPIDVRLKVACTRQQLLSELIGSEVDLEITCNDILGESEVRRIVITLMAIPDTALSSTGLIKDINSYVDPLAFFEIDGVGAESLSSNCYQIRLRRKSATLDSSSSENLTAGFLRNIPDTTTDCAREKCYTFEKSGDVNFGTTFIVVQTNSSGLLVAGNITGRVFPPSPFNDDLEGIGTGVAGQAARALLAGVGFIVAAVVVTWLAVSNVCVSSSPEEGADVETTEATMWEYVERDLFGRESHLKEASRGSISESQLAIPQGAKPPLISPGM